MPSASETLAAFAADLRFAALPPAVVAKMKLHVLDLLGPFAEQRLGRDVGQQIDQREAGTVCPQR